MKTIKFVNTDRKQFAATLRKNVSEHFRQKGISTKGNWKMGLKSIIMLSLYVAPFIILLTIPMSGWIIFPISLLMGIAMAGVGMSVMHDAAHGSFSTKNWVNKLIAHSIYMLGGSIFTWKVQHNILHHTYTNIDGFDEDIENKLMFRMSKASPRKRMHRFQHIYALGFYSLMTLAKMVKDFVQLARYNKNGITKQQGADPRAEWIRLVASKTIYLLVMLGLPLLFTGFSWWLILLGFLVMHLSAGLIMSTVFQMAHIVEEADQPVPSKEGIIENEWTIHELETTANFARGSRWFGWGIGGLNYQIEHHLFPNICHIHYRELSPIVERTAMEFGLRYNQNRTFFRAIGSHFRLLRALGRA
jgi:linoleoyl-CoA desaturase